MTNPSAAGPAPPEDSEFGIANRAFELFSLPERRLALEKFATLKYPSIEDRFCGAVHFVIQGQFDAD